MKWMHGSVRRERTFGVYILLAVLLFGPAISKADVVLDWNAIAVDTAIANGANPVTQARFGAIVQLAVFEAVNAITRDYEPYLGTIVAPPGASAEAAAIQAAYDVLVSYFPNSKPTLDLQRAAWLALINDGQAKAGIATGDAAAAAMITLGANDGSSPPTLSVSGRRVPGKWQATPKCP